MKNKTLKSIILLSLVFFLVVAAFGCSGQDKKSEEEGSKGSEEGDVIKFCAYYNLSGNSSDTGPLNIDAINFAVKHINEAGGIKSMNGAKLEPVIADTMSDASQANTVMERVLATEKIVAMIGAGGSGYTLGILPTCEKQKIISLTAGVSNAITDQGYRFSFRAVPSGGQFGQTQVQFLEWLNDVYKLDIKKVAIIYENTEYGNSTSQGNKELVESAGLEVVYEESFPVGLSDASSLISAMKASGAQAVFPTCFTQDAKQIVNSMTSLNYFPLVIGGGAGFLYPAFAEELGDEVDGIVSVASNSWDTKAFQQEGLEEIANDFEKEYGYFMSEHSVGAYNNVYILAAALEKAGTTDPDALVEAMHDLKIPVIQPGGTLEFAEDGSNKNAEAVIIQWQKSEDGKFRPRTIFPEGSATAEYIHMED